MSQKKALELEIIQSLLDLMAQDVNYGMDKECVKRLLRTIMESVFFSCLLLSFVLLRCSVPHSCTINTLSCIVLNFKHFIVCSAIC